MSGEWVEIIPIGKREITVAVGETEDVALYASAGFRKLVGVVEADQDTNIEIHWGFTVSAAPPTFLLVETIALSAGVARSFVLDVVAPIVKVTLVAGAADTTFSVYAALRR